MARWTDEQLNAINAETGTLIVSAAAGSGKTSVLVERIVRKLTDLENPCEPDELLVVTFTNAAAAEMRSRIYKRLGEKIKECPEDKLRLSRIRARLEEMQVSTMDAFCMKLVKENYSVCDIEPDFSLLDEGVEKVLEKDTAKEVIEELYSQQSETFLNLAKIFENGRNDENLLNGILSLSDYSMSEPDPEAWLDGVADNFLPAPAADSVWGQIMRSHFKECIDYAISLNEKMIDELSYCDGLAEKYENDYEINKMLLEKNLVCIESGSWDEICASFENTYLNFSPKRFGSERDGTGHKKNAGSLKNAARDIVKDLYEKIPANEEENAEDVKVLRPVADELIKTVKLFNRKLLEKKKDNNAYSFSDISHFALSLLSDPLSPDGKTELARELSENLKEILIDEYQDTNRAQDTLFTCLSKNGGNMFMVGDVKQSIYRFRLASPELFIEKCESFPYYDGKSNPSKIILSKNFRSRRGVTEAVNYMFSGLMSKNCGDIEYNDDERLNFAADYEDDGTADTELHFIDNKDDNEIETEAEYIAKLIKEKLDGGLCVYKNGVSRKAEYSDFCILLRVAKNTAPVYAEVLRKHSIPVTLDANDNFFSSPEIKMACSLLRIINDPSGDIDLLAVLMSPVFGFSPEEVAEIRITAKEIFGNKKYSLYNGLKLCAEKYEGRYASFVKTLTLWRKTAACETVCQTLQRVYDDTSLMAIAESMPDGAMRKANLRTLLISAQSYAPTGNAGIAGFVKYIDLLIENGEKMRNSAACVQGNGVSIMTMHRSKGLEYPFVIIAGLTKRLRNSQGASELSVNHRLGIGLKRREPENIKLYNTLSSVGVENENTVGERSELLRLLYVAMTRAKEKLYIVMAPKNCAKGIIDLQREEAKSIAVPSYRIKNVSAPWKLLLMAFDRHPDAGEIRFNSDYVRTADFKLKTVFVPNDAVIEDEINEDIPTADRELAEKLADGMKFSYKYLPVSSCASKHTASNIGSEHFSPASFGKSVPGFMFKASLSPAEIGTATHLFLQYCDFTECELDLEKEKNRLLNSGRLSEQQMSAVNTEAVAGFFASDVYSRIKKSDCVIRERQFTVLRKISELEENIPDEFAEERTVVIGKTDLIFTENGKAVIVDYKTDNISDISVLPERYSKQMELYKDAVKRSLGLEVKECVLYSIKLHKEISL